MKNTISSRRAYLSAIAVGSLSALAGCGSDDSDESDEPDSPEEGLRQQANQGFEEYGTWVETVNNISVEVNSNQYEVLNTYTYDYTSGGPQEVQDHVNIVSTAVFEAIYTGDYSAARVGLNAIVPTVDEYGEESESLFSIVEMSSVTADQINWDNFLSENLPSVADVYQYDGSYFRE